MPGTVAVLTMSRGHHDHLLAQVDGLSVGTTPPDVHVVISMGDRDLTRGRLPLGTDRWRTIVKPVQTDRRALPYAAARNLAAELAVDAGADVLVFLHSAVIPGPRTLERYARAVAERDDPDLPEGPVVWCSPVLRLPPVDNPAVGYPLRKLDELSRRAPGAPVLAPGEVRVEERLHLFSPASFAVSAQDYAAVGGFCSDYAGPGLEAADFARCLRRAGGSMAWVGGAEAYRQPTEPPTPEEEARYARRHVESWRERWGAEPDHPWLTRLVGEGAIRRDANGRIADPPRR
ncbi:glycosyltransferase family 2 protein [Serinicoccus hydrothermalis]|uniref:glycosyltransferase family 2 protein n=1 Tax=Serinicoccus hydrothermalis TaxID=1758689 RepID=UPI0012FB0143|nr:hypothetical protein [Serinicoccus hydrothermalis]